MAEDESTFTSFPSLSKANTLSSLTQQDLESLPEMSSKQVDQPPMVVPVMYALIPLPGTPGTPMFEGANVTDFLQR